MPEVRLRARLRATVRRRPLASAPRPAAVMLVATVGLTAFAACVPRPQAPVVVVSEPELPAPISPLPGVLHRAQELADRGQFLEADRVLADFAISRPGTPEGAEADFWRALLRADPANSQATVRDQLAAIDAYLSGGPEMPRYMEALIVRRLVETADSARSMITAVRAAAQARERAKEDEARRLAEELEKALAELDRIRRRLAPKPPDPKPPA